MRRDTPVSDQRDGVPNCSIPPKIPWIDAVGRTIEAIQHGADVVYQATFQDGPWGGRADFLVRVERPSFSGGFFVRSRRNEACAISQGRRYPAALFLFRAPVEDPGSAARVDACGARG